MHKAFKVQAIKRSAYSSIHLQNETEKRVLLYFDEIEKSDKKAKEGFYWPINTY